jgi:hypothetical protein
MRYSQSGILKDTRPWGKMFVAGAAAVTLSVAIFACAFAATTSVIYDATPSPTPYNVPSLGFEATATTEFGDRITLPKAGERLSRAEVTMSTWAKQSEYPNNSLYSSSQGWTHPITVNVYSVNTDGTKGQLIDSQERSTQIPWRPESDPTCPNTDYGQGFAWRASDGNCYNGLAFTAGINFDSPEVLPKDVIVSVAYDTQSYGKPAPIGAPGPYNSLNVGIPTNQIVQVGTDYEVNSLFWDSTYDGRTSGLANDSGWSPNGTVALKLFTNVDTLTKDACKKNGWKTLGVDGKDFKNQGECVAYTAANPNASFKREQ